MTFQQCPPPLDPKLFPREPGDSVNLPQGLAYAATVDASTETNIFQGAALIAPNFLTVATTNTEDEPLLGAALQAGQPGDVILVLVRGVILVDFIPGPGPNDQPDLGGLISSTTPGVAKWAEFGGGRGLLLHWQLDPDEAYWLL